MLDRMNIHQQIALTLNTAADLANWRAWAALAAMIVTIGGMLAMMWFLSSQPTSDARGWLCGGASAAGLVLWRALLPLAVAHGRRGR